MALNHSVSTSFSDVLCWDYKISDILKPIIRANFFHLIILLVDIKYHILHNGKASSLLTLLFRLTMMSCELDQYVSFLSIYTYIAEHPEKHSFTHHIRTSGLPMSFCAHHLAQCCSPRV